MPASAPVRPSPENDPLLEAAMAGDRDAFGRLVERYRAYLKTVAQRVLADRLPSDGSDAVQTGLAAAFAHLGQFRGEPAAFLGWLAAIVRNAAREFLRRAEPTQALPDSTAGDQLAESSSRPDARVSQREEAARLVSAVHGLPADYGTVIDLRNLKELPFEEVARRMGRSSDAVRKLWTRAMDRLRQELGDQS